MWLSRAPNGPSCKVSRFPASVVLQYPNLDELVSRSKQYVFGSIAPTRQLLTGLVSTQLELHFAGNCLKGSRPLLSWDQAFETEPQLQRAYCLDTFLSFVC